MLEVFSKGQKLGQTISLKMQRDRKNFLLAITLPLLTFQACIKRNSVTDDKNTPRVVRLATATLPKTRDWTECTSIECARHARLVMRGLFDVGEFEKLSEREYRVTLAPVRWSDGRRLVAKDFLESWKKVLRDCERNRAATALFVLQGAETFCRNGRGEIGAWEETPHQLRLRFARPVISVPRAFAQTVTWPRRLDATNPKPTLGPYLPALQRGTYARNPFYEPPVPVDTLIFVPARDPLAQIDLVREGSLDGIESLPEETFEAMRRDPYLSLLPTGQHVSVGPAQTPRAFVKALSANEATLYSKAPLLALDGASEPDPAAARRQLARESLEREWVLTWDPKVIPSSLASNLAAQWVKNLGVAVTLSPKKAGVAPSGENVLVLLASAETPGAGTALWEKARPLFYRTGSPTYEALFGKGILFSAPGSR